ncbi:MAG: DUF2950 domain-containing protein [Bryobacteraceae bacterium]
MKIWPLVVFFACNTFAWAEANVAPKVFATPEEAATALVSATAQNNQKELTIILGTKAKELVAQGDGIADPAKREKFFQMAKESLHVVPDPFNLNRFQIAVGTENWPVPLPIVKVKGGYRFDPAAAELEILARHIGANELEAIEDLRDFVAAEREYAYSDLNKNGMRDYAQQIISTSGKHDGLYWQGDPACPLAKVVGRATAAGYSVPSSGLSPTYSGYVFRMLKAQGPDAAGGTREYVVQGAMIGGFAFVAYPAQYGVTGVKTFLVNQEGTVLEKDLGANTKALAAAMKRYNPDKTWHESPYE